MKKINEGKSLVTTTVREGGGGAAGVAAEIPLQTCGRDHGGAVEKCEEKGAAERSCDGLTTAPIPHLPVLLRVGGHRFKDEEVTLSFRKGKGRRSVVLTGLCFSLSESVLIEIKLKKCSPS